MATVYFYKCRLFEEHIITSKTSDDILRREYKTKEKLEELFKAIITNKGKVLHENNNKCVPIDDAPDWVLMEILNIGNTENTITECGLEDADYIFGRIGKKKDITNVQKRNRYTYEPEDIEKDPEQDIEVYTYFYIFFKTSVIVYLGAKSAPGIKKIDDMFKRYYKETNLRTETVPVTAEDMVEILVHKDIVNSFEIATTLPSDEVLNIDNLGLDESLFDKLRDEKNMKITVSIFADGRNKNIFKQNSLIKDTVSSLLNRTNGNKSKFRFKAKNNNEKIQEYDIIEKSFTKSITFQYRTDEGENRRKEIEKKLYELYSENSADIVRYCRD